MARPTLFNNPKFVLAQRRLKECEAHLLGHLEFMWAAANESGEPIFANADLVEAAARWDGEEGKFAQVLSQAGSNFLDLRSNGSYEIHDYWHHVPDYVKSRRRMEEKRKSSSEKFETVPNSSEKFVTPAPAPAPAPTKEGGEGADAQPATPEPTPTDAPPPDPDTPATAGDPPLLSDFLSKQYPKILAAIQEHHPKAAPPPPGTPDDTKARQALADLVTRDGYTEREVVDTLRWVLRDDHKDALFWRQQLKTPAVLRKTRNGVTKFAQIFDQREAALRTAPKAPVKTQAQIDMDAAWAHIQKHGGIVYTS